MGRKDVNEIIKEAREEKGITQEELAKMIRISRNKMEKIEAGNYNIKPHFLKRMSKYIDINYNELMYLIGYGIDVTPLNYFIKDYYYNLNLEELESSRKVILFRIITNKQAVNTFKKIIDEYKLNDYEKEILTEKIDDLEYQINSSKEIIKLIKSEKIRKEKKKKHEKI